MNILFVTPIPEDKKSLFTAIPGARIIFKDRASVTAEDLEGIDAVLGNLPAPLVSAAESVRWLQLDSAGADPYRALPERIVLTNASGAYGEAISEHLLACTLAVMKKLMPYREMQSRREWENLGSVNTISMMNVLSVGMGDIGTEYARRMKLLGARVSGVRRTVHDKPDFLDDLYSMEQLPDIIGDFDIVALSLPGTPETKGLFNEELMRKMKKGAILLNVGRGSAIVMDDLVRIMKDGHLTAACLDVTDPEPLPKNHALWNTENVYITPHIAGRFNAAVTYDKVLGIFHDNLIRFLAGEKLENIVDKKRGY